MREFLFWAFVLTALPGCQAVFPIDAPPPDDTTPDPGFNLVRGPLPREGAVFCDVILARRCATSLDIEQGIALTDAALALNTGRSSSIGLDYSAAAMANCAATTGGPEAIQFLGKFPEGEPVCLNCGEVFGAGKANADAAAVCQAFCHDQVLNAPNEDGVAFPVKPPTADTITSCSATASVSTNMTLDACIGNACEASGTPVPFFLDPRRTPEPVVWFDPAATGAAAGGADGNDLTRTTATPGAFDAGAVSEQWITRGDAFVEFSAAAGGSVLVGFAEVPSGCTDPAACPDADATDVSIKFGILLRYDGEFFIYESGVQRNGAGLDGSFGPSAAGDRFRVYVRDKNDGTASVRYAKLVGPCTPGAICNETVFYTSTVVATYPLRVDSSLFHQGATATDVRLMRIKN